jgi:hypothetical protein
MATKERLNDATQAVKAALKAEKKKGKEFQAFIQLQKASDHCKKLADEPSWQDKQRKNLLNSAQKAAEGVQRLTGKLTPDELDAAMSMINPATDGTVDGTVGDGATDDPNGVELMAGETEEQYVARQQRLKDEAKARMEAKFGATGVSGQYLADAESAVAQQPATPQQPAAPQPQPAAVPAAAPAAAATVMLRGRDWSAQFMQKGIAKIREATEVDTRVTQSGSSEPNRYDEAIGMYMNGIDYFNHAVKCKFRNTNPAAPKHSTSGRGRESADTPCAE